MARITFALGATLTAANLTTLSDEIYGWQANVNANSKDLSAVHLQTFDSGGYVNSDFGVNIAPAKLASASTPHTRIAAIKGMLVLGYSGQAVNDDALVQLSQFGFAGGQNWSGISFLGRNFAVKSTGGADTRYTPVTHGSIGYQGIEISDAIRFYCTAGATTAGSAVSPASVLTVAVGKVSIGNFAPSYLLDIGSGGATAAQFHLSHDNSDVGLYLSTGAATSANFTCQAAYNGSAWIAKGTAAGIIAINSGAIGFYTASGLTPGASFSPGSYSHMSIDTAGLVGLGGAWNGGHLVMATYHLWVDGSGRLRIKSGAPVSDVDGAVVGLQS